MLTEPHFHNEDAARDYLERLRWPSERTCPHCGTVGHSFVTQKRGVYRCGDPACRMDFTVTTKTVMESSHIPLTKWLTAFYFMCSSKKGVSAHQIHRTLKISYKSAWFMCHRIREAMRAGGLAAPMGGSGGVVEADETLSGKVKGAPRKMRREHKGLRNVVFTLVERGGSARSFHVDGTTIATLGPIIRANIAREAALMTDEAPWYPERGMKGIYQHCSEKHLHRYLAEFDFRYSYRVKLGVDDLERAERAIRGAEGKRLYYRQPSGAQFDAGSIPF